MNKRIIFSIILVIMGVGYMNTSRVIYNHFKLDDMSVVFGMTLSLAFIFTLIGVFILFFKISLIKKESQQSS